ncbi:hypothetical protein EXN66_Car002689 [Channa argus]|uniref:Uncharacterized protein n=1 Tax=Channa argus TaxID=215402 RepID=A0A6G1P9U5_CHAAH|nr:hypothetical protein EXN66_Car002689 [Channa argus]
MLLALTLSAGTNSGFGLIQYMVIPGHTGLVKYITSNQCVHTKKLFGSTSLTTINVVKVFD